MHIYFGTVVRGATLPDSGELVKLDWDAKAVVAKAPVLQTIHTIANDPNPRGNTRGYRGIAIHNGHVIAATYHTLHIFNAALRHVRAVSHGLMADLHEVYSPCDGTLWVTATAIDAALRYELTTGTLLEAFWPRQMRALQRALQLTPNPCDAQSDYRTRLLDADFSSLPSHLHLNAIGRWNGDFYALFNQRGAIVNLSESRTVVSDAYLRGAHNLLVSDDGTALINDTYRGALRRYDLATGKLLWSAHLPDHRWVRSLVRWPNLKYRIGVHLHKPQLITERIARPLFVRGLAQHGNQLFVGVSPAAIISLDAESGHLLDAYQFSNNVHVCIHGLCVSA